MATTNLKIRGMHCGHCVASVKGALEGVPGVRGAEVDLDAGRAVVDHDTDRATTGELVGAVMDEGYTAEKEA